VKKFQVYGIYSVAVFIGEVEAKTEEEAISIAEEQDPNGGTITLCHECNRNCGDDLNCGRYEAHEVQL
jgi:hypothetical protein